MAKLHTFVDAFSTLDTSRWAFAANASINAGQLQLTTAGVYEGAQSLSTYDLTDSFGGVEMTQTAGPGNNTVDTEFDLVVGADFLSWVREGGHLYAQRYVGGTFVNVIPPFTYNATAHRWWRFFHDGVQVLWQVSADAVSWTTTASWTPTFSVTAVSVRIMTGYYGTESAPGIALINGLNTFASTWVGSGSGTATSSATGDGTVDALAAGIGSAVTDAIGSGTSVITAPSASASASTFAIGSGTVFNPFSSVTFTDLSGTFFTDRGERLVGTVVLTPDVGYRVDSASNKIIVIGPRVITLANGSFTARIPANASNWRWKCDVIPDESPTRRTFYFTIPTGASQVNIADCVDGIPGIFDPVTPPAETYPGLSTYPSLTLFPSA